MDCYKRARQLFRNEMEMYTNPGSPPNNAIVYTICSLFGELLKPGGLSCVNYYTNRLLRS